MGDLLVHQLRRLLIYAAALCFGVSAAEAAREPILVAAPDWVVKIAVPKPDPARAGAPLQPLLIAMQTRYSADGTAEYHIESATTVQHPHGLAAVGTIALPWQPDTTELRVHRLDLIRDGKARDLLAGGTGFMVLRRENNLERAMLDGTLTAVMQPEGIAVGDTLHIAYTIKTLPGSLKLKSEHQALLLAPVTVRRLMIRELWPASAEVRWRGSRLPRQPRLSEGTAGTELLLDLADYKMPEAPALAPPRFQLPPLVEVSGYRNWEELSALMAPAYQAAAALQAGSPLAQEIARIAAANSDEPGRALAALKSVQDNVRYLALGMGEGGLVPATAEQTWSRRYGDCKGKTVTLLAMLRGLGIEAEPVLVNSALGDALPDRLPAVGQFDHVLVRAHIGGRTYWMDGTRLGDRDLDSLLSLPFRWGLPLTTAGAGLESLPLRPPSRPPVATEIVYDASAGFTKEVPFTAGVVFSGDLASEMRVAIAQLGPQHVATKARELASNIPDADPASLKISQDDKAGTVTLAMSGKRKLSWRLVAGRRRFTFDDGTIDWMPNFKRDDSAIKDVPYQLEFPVFIETRETIILPRGGEGFTLFGKSFDRTVAGTQIARAISLEGGRATARSIFRGLQPEIAAAEALAAEAGLKTINGDVAGIDAPMGYRMEAAEREAILASEPKTADEYLDRGYQLLQGGSLVKALADFDKAAALDPTNSRPLANRALVLVRQGKFGEARAVLAKAAPLGEDDFVVPQVQGLLDLEEDRPEAAVSALTRSLSLDPANSFTLKARARAYEMLGRLDEAAADVRQAAPEVASDDSARWWLIRILAYQDKRDEALTLAREAGDGWQAQMMQGTLLRRFGRTEEAKAAFSRAIADFDRELEKAVSDRESLALLRYELLSTSGDVSGALAILNERLRRFPGATMMLNARCWLRATHGIELERAFADCLEALKADPRYTPARDSLAFVKLRLGRLDEAIADYDKALKEAPQLAASFYGRGIAKLRKGDKAGGERDLATARRYSFDIDSSFANYGVIP